MLILLPDVLYIVKIKNIWYSKKLFIKFIIVKFLKMYFQHFLRHNLVH